MFSRLFSAFTDCVRPQLELDNDTLQQASNRAQRIAGQNRLGAGNVPITTQPQRTHYPAPLQQVYRNTDRRERVVAIPLPALPNTGASSQASPNTNTYAITRSGLMPVRQAQQQARPATPPERPELTAAHKAARRNPEAFIKQVDPNQFTEAEKEELARTVMKKDPEEFFRAFHKFGFEGEAKERMVREYARWSPTHFMGDLLRLQLPGGALNLEMAKLCAEKAPARLCMQIKHFGIENENDRLDIARIAAEKCNPEEMAEYSFDLGPMYFDIRNPDNKRALAEIMVDRVPLAFCAGLSAFGIADEALRETFARKIMESAPGTVARYIDNFGLADEAVRIDIACTIARSSEAASLAFSIGRFAISDENTRIELARTISKTAPASLGKCLHGFKIGAANQDVVAELARVAAQHAPLDTVRHIIANNFRGQLISDPAVRKELLLTAYTAALSTLGSDELRSAFGSSSDCPELRSLNDAAKAYGNRSEVFERLEKYAADQDNEHTRELLLDWTYRAAIRFRHVPQEVAKQLEDSLKAIQTWRAPEQRDAITRILVEQFLGKDKDAASALVNFTNALHAEKRFSQGKTQLLPMLLFPIIKDPQSETLKRLAALRTKADLKNAKNLKPLISGLIGMVNATRVSVELKQKLLHAVVVQAASGNQAAQLGQTLAVIGHFLALANEDNDMGRSMKQILNDGENLDTTIKAATEKLFGLDNIGNSDLLARFKQYQAGARDPNALIAYAAKIHNELASPDKEAVLNALRKFVESAVLGSEETFRAVRYDTESSPHLRTIAEDAPQQWQAWQRACTLTPAENTALDAAETDIRSYLHRRLMLDRHLDIGAYPGLADVLLGKTSAEQALAAHASSASEDDESLERNLLQLLRQDISPAGRLDLIDKLIDQVDGQFRSDLQGLRTLLAPPKRREQDYSQWKVVDTDAPEDLLLCGTEVVGSCQNLHGNVRYNKAVFGYVMDGKYRMLAVKSPDGRIQSRAMLRLMWTGEKPVLHLERRYGNAGVPEALESAIVELAKQKAREMGCPLVTHEADYGAGDLLGEEIHAGENPWPFEYVDAEDDNGVHRGGEPYSFTTARVIATD